MADPIAAESKVLLAKIEGTYGSDPAPTGAANAILATGFQVSPMEAEEASRDLERPYRGGQEQVPVAIRGVMTFSTELAGSGAAGTAPAWGPLARACGMAETINAGVDVSYAPISASYESVTIHFWQGPTRHVFLGCRGTATITVPAQAIPRIRWTFTGIWTQPSDQAPATPTLTAFQEPLVATTVNTPVFTVDAVSLVLRQLSFDLANQVEPRFLIGADAVVIVDSAELISATIEATPLATFNPFSLAYQRTKVAVALTHGTVAGNIVAISAPTSQVGRPTGQEENQKVIEWPITLRPLPNVGNDQFSITLT